jgi:5-methylcytosine-specific restriction endonuclease McrA
MAAEKRVRGRQWMAIRAAIIARDSAYHGGIPTCEYCGRSVVTDPKMRVQVDHIIPLEQGGGAVDFDNLVTSCSVCNGSGGFWFGHKPEHIKQAVLRLVRERNRA